MTGDRRSQIHGLLENFYREIYNNWGNDEQTLELVRRELEDLLIAVENNLARIRMSNIEN